MDLEVDWLAGLGVIPGMVLPNFVVALRGLEALSRYDL